MEGNAVDVHRSTPGPARSGRGSVRVYWMEGGSLQLHEAVRVQKVQVQVQLPDPLHEPLAQVTLQVGRSSCAYTCRASRGAKQRAAAASSAPRASRMRVVR
jgi:hypothetical protein